MFVFVLLACAHLAVTDDGRPCCTIHPQLKGACCAASAATRPLVRGAPAPLPSAAAMPPQYRAHLPRASSPMFVVVARNRSSAVNASPSASPSAANCLGPAAGAAPAPGRPSRMPAAGVRWWRRPAGGWAAEPRCLDPLPC